MDNENLRLKRSLVVQSFAPLFVLLILKHWNLCEYIRLVDRFNEMCAIAGLFSAIGKSLDHPLFGSFVVSMLGLIWIALTMLVAVQYNKIQKSGFDSHGETITIGEASGDGGATFLVTYVLPLLTDDVGTIGKLLAFIAMLAFILWLLTYSNSFYQNPVLTAMGYKTFAFKFDNPYIDIKGGEEKTYIGITRGEITEEANIKRKYIADDVFMIYND